MKPFTYQRAEKPAEAVKAIMPKAKFLAGGTNLIDLMKLEVEKPVALVDINGLPLDQVEKTPAGGVKIGALARNSDVAENSLIKAAYPVLSEAFLSGASPQLRNAATVGGNLLQRTRCPYFTDVSQSCNKREPGAGCSAAGGYTRSLAVLGTSDFCYATNPSDMCVALAALEAIVHVTGPAGDRAIPFADFHKLPGDTPHIETSLKADELIIAVELPALAWAKQSTYLKVRDRASYAFALVSAAVILDIADDAIRGARIAMGGVGTKPWRSPEAEKLLVGKPVKVESFQIAAEAALRDARPLKFNGFKIELAKRTLVRALSKVAGLEG